MAPPSKVLKAKPVWRMSDALRGLIISCVGLNVKSEELAALIASKWPVAVLVYDPKTFSFEVNLTKEADIDKVKNEGLS